MRRAAGALLPRSSLRLRFVFDALDAARGGRGAAGALLLRYSLRLRFVLNAGHSKTHSTKKHIMVFICRSYFAWSVRVVQTANIAHPLGGRLQLFSNLITCAHYTCCLSGKSQSIAHRLSDCPQAAAHCSVLPCLDKHYPPFKFAMLRASLTSDAFAWKLAWSVRASRNHCSPSRLPSASGRLQIFSNLIARAQRTCCSWQIARHCSPFKRPPAGGRTLLHTAMLGSCKH